MDSNTSCNREMRWDGDGDGADVGDDVDDDLDDARDDDDRQRRQKIVLDTLNCRGSR